MKTIVCNSSLVNCWIIFILNSILSPTQAQLEATYSSVHLPIPDVGQRPWYDGKNDVYLFGSSFKVKDFNSILRYSFSNDSIHLETSLPVKAILGSLQSDHDGNIVYLGADFPFGHKVLKYNLTTKSLVVPFQTPYSFISVPTLKMEDGRVLPFGDCEAGWDLLFFDLTNSNVTHMAEKLPVSLVVEV